MHAYTNTFEVIRAVSFQVSFFVWAVHFKWIIAIVSNKSLKTSRHSLTQGLFDGKNLTSEGNESRFML